MAYSEEAFIKLEEDENQSALSSLAIIYATLGRNKLDVLRELQDFYARYGKDGVITYKEARKWISEKDHRKRISLIKSLVDANFEGLEKTAKTQFEELLNDIVSKEEEFFDTKTDKQEVIEKSWGNDDLNWKDRLHADALLWSLLVYQDITKAFLLRRTFKDLEKQIELRYGTIENALKMLAITETTAIGSLARQNILKKLGIKQYRFYARDDERTCQYCGELHGKTFPMTAYEVGVTASPIHPRCRCWEVPVEE